MDQKKKEKGHPIHALRFHKLLRTFVEFRQRLEFLSKDPDAEMPDSISDLVGSVLPGWDGEDLVQFFQSESYIKGEKSVSEE
jgi:hypothetical protein